MSDVPVPAPVRESQRPVAVVGAGGWGTALACVLARGGNRVRLWARRPEFAAEVEQRRENAVYLPGVPLPGAVVCTADLATALDGARLVVFATPAQALRDVCSRAAGHIEPGSILVSASKGIEIGTLKRMSEVLAEVLGRPDGEGIAALSGPNFAVEVGRGLPAATVLAARDMELASEARQPFAGRPELRVYTHTDVVGVEVGGALKNVIALVAGMVEGLGLGLNARAGVITRGLAEVTRLGVAMGAQPLTFAGLSGLGDLVLTCTGGLSRNLGAGRELGAGRSIEEIQAGTRMVIEGASTTRAARTLAGRHSVEMPLTEQMYQVLFEHKRAQDVVREILSRDLRAEIEKALPPAEAGRSGRGRSASAD